jgi:hypothetical protein
MQFAGHLMRFHGGGGKLAPHVLIRYIAEEVLIIYDIICAAKLIGWETIFGILLPTLIRNVSRICRPID